MSRQRDLSRLDGPVSHPAGASPHRGEAPQLLADGEEHPLSPAEGGGKGAGGAGACPEAPPWRCASGQPLLTSISATVAWGTGRSGGAAGGAGSRSDPPASLFSLEAAPEGGCGV